MISLEEYERFSKSLPEYFWYLGGGSGSVKLALVEKAKNAVTKNGWTSDYKSIQLTGTNFYQIDTVKFAAVF